MKKLKGSPAQLLKSWYIGFFQIPFLPELILPLGDFWFYRWILKKSSCPGSYSEEDDRILLERLPLSFFIKTRGCGTFRILRLAR